MGGLAQRTLGVVPLVGFGPSLCPLEHSGVGGWGIVHCSLCVPVLCDVQCVRDRE